MSKRSLTALTLSQTVEVIKCLENNETQTSLAVKFNAGQAVISRIKHDKDRILEEWRKNASPDRKRQRAGQA